jgi:hypothetical protein
MYARLHSEGVFGGAATSRIVVDLAAIKRHAETSAWSDRADNSSLIGRSSVSTAVWRLNAGRPTVPMSIRRRRRDKARCGYDRRMLSIGYMPKPYHRWRIDRSSDPHPAAGRKLDLDHAGSLGYRWRRCCFGLRRNCDRFKRRRNLGPLT